MPVVLWLHGGVNGTRQDRGAEVAHYFANESDSLYFIFAAASGERGATWFDEVGIRNILQSLHYIKSRYNVDDNRVILAGVSDGGTGCYVSGMNYPDEFAGYLVCSASPSLLPMMGIPVLPGNMRLRPWHIVHGGKDHLYPGEEMKALMEKFKAMGIPLTFHYYPDMPHGLDYMPMEKPAVMDFFRTTVRNPQPAEIQFETYSGMKVSWLSVDSLLPPPPFSENTPASIHARISGNRVEIRSTGVRVLSIYAAAPLFNAGEELHVVWNGKNAFQGRAQLDTDVMLETAGRWRDRAFLPFCRLELALPESVN